MTLKVSRRMYSQVSQQLRTSPTSPNCNLQDKET